MHEHSKFSSLLNSPPSPLMCRGIKIWLLSSHHIEQPLAHRRKPSKVNKNTCERIYYVYSFKKKNLYKMQNKKKCDIHYSLILFILLLHDYHSRVAKDNYITFFPFTCQGKLKKHTLVFVGIDCNVHIFGALSYIIITSPFILFFNHTF